MKKRKQAKDLRNGKRIVRWYENPDPGDETIAALLQDPQIRQSFIKASLKDGLKHKDLKVQLQYFNVYP